MTRIADALELLTAQHEQLADLLNHVTTVDLEHRALALGELADKLTTHLAAEQELFFPSIAAANPSVAAQEWIVEHDEMKRVIAELLVLDLDAVASSPLLGELAERLDRHAQSDDTLFVAIAEAVPEDELIGLGTQMREWSESSLCIAA